MKFSSFVALLALAACAQTSVIPAEMRESFLWSSNDLNEASINWQASLTAEQKQMIQVLNAAQQRFVKAKSDLQDFCAKQDMILDEAAIQRKILQCTAKK